LGWQNKLKVYALRFLHKATAPGPGSKNLAQCCFYGFGLEKNKKILLFFQSVDKALSTNILCYRV